MSFDDLASAAGTEIRQAAARRTVPDLAVGRTRRQRRRVVAGGALALVAAAAVVAITTPGGEIDRPDVAVTTTLAPEPAADGLSPAATGVVLLFDDGLGGVLAIDPDRRIGSRRSIDGHKAGDPPYRLDRVGDHLVVGWGDIHAVDIATGASASIGDATIFVPATEPGRVWLLDYPSGRIQGTPTAWQVDMDGTVLTGSREVDIDGFPAIGIPGGLAVETDDGLLLWDLAAGSDTNRLGTGRAQVSDSHGDLIAWCDEGCSELTISNSETGAPLATIGSTADSAGRPFGGRNGRFSPDGRLFAIVRDDVLHVLDFASDDGTDAVEVALHPTDDLPSYLAWSPDGDQLFVATWSYGLTTMRIARYDVEARTMMSAELPFGGTISFVMLDPDEAVHFLRNQDQPSEACASGGSLCGFRF